MKLSIRILAAIVVVCVLGVVLRTPYALASPPVATPGTADRDALAALYHATDGDNWTSNYNWLSDAPLDTWYGVTTDEGGRVSEVNLWLNNLSGKIPPDLGDLTNLDELYLSGNRLRGCLPAVWKYYVVENDLDQLGLPYCVASSPTSHGSSGETHLLPDLRRGLADQEIVWL